MEFGYFLSSEEHGPHELVEQGRRAAAAGLPELMISDHYHPWIDRQGHSPFVWSVIGALSQIEGVTITTGVTCPTVRTHPAVIAQAAATSAVLTDGRFRLGIGSGENLNEHILGVDWPDADTRLDMLEESIEVMRELWEGAVTSHHGPHYTVRNARVYDLPDEPPPVLVSGFGPKATELAGRVGDGYVSTRPDAELVELFEKSGGAGKLKIAGAKVCYGEDRDAAVALAHELWPTSGVPGELAQELPSPAHFEQVAELVTPEQIGEKMPCGNDPDEFVEAIRAYDDAGFDLVFLQQIGPDQAGFLRFFDETVRPRL
jgi:G6PDH family F420-dependent oxidoreductase